MKLKRQKNPYSESEVFVTDTHALLWHLTDDERLSKNAKDMEVIMKYHELIKIPELHDRIIVATAVLLDAKLITKDPVITVINEMR